MKSEHNPSRYRKLSQPHADLAGAQAAIDAFMDDVLVAREKHGIPDVLFAVAVNVIVDGEESNAEVIGHYGDSFRELPLAAMAYAKAKERHEAMIAKMASWKKL